MHKARYVGRGMEHPSSPSSPFFRHLNVFTNLEALWNPFFWVLWGFHYIGMIESLATGNWFRLEHFFPLPSLKVRGVGLKFKFSNHKIGSPGNQTRAWGASKIHLIKKRGVIERSLLLISRHLYLSHHLRNSKGLRSSVQETGWRPNT